jgi:hypothetical protein
MADHSKAKHHHAKAGDAFKRGDMKQAAHHMGHALAALRNAPPAGGDAIPAEDADEMVETPVAASTPSLRDRLKRFGK